MIYSQIPKIAYNDPSIPEVQWLQDGLELYPTNSKFTEKLITLQEEILDLGEARFSPSGTRNA